MDILISVMSIPVLLFISVLLRSTTASQSFNISNLGLNFSHRLRSSPTLKRASQLLCQNLMHTTCDMSRIEPEILAQRHRASIALVICRNVRLIVSGAHTRRVRDAILGRSIQDISKYRVSVKHQNV